MGQCICPGSPDIQQPSWSSTRTPGICKSQMKGQITLFHPDVISDRKRGYVQGNLAIHYH